MNCPPRIVLLIALVCLIPAVMSRGVAAAPADAPDSSAAPDKSAAPDSSAAPDNSAAPATAPSTEAPAGTETAATSQPAETTPAEAPGANQTLAQQVEDFRYYGEVARYDLQVQLGNKILAQGQANPEELLKIFEQVWAQHKTPQGAPAQLDTELLRWQAADPQMKTVASQLLDLLNKGRFARRQDQQFITANIKRLNQGERAYGLAIRDLRNSGELAVPQMVQMLISDAPEDVEYHDVIRRALVDLGREALNPLLAATQMSPKTTALTSICGVLGDIGYPASIPYLSALIHNPQSSNEVRQAASIALRRLNGNPNAIPGDLFYDLAEKFYYGSASIQADPRSPRAFIWYWNNGLASKSVPPPIFNDIMAMRENEHALMWNVSQPDQAVALWLAANVRRSIDLPNGQTDPTRAADEPQPHYYNVAEGAKYLNLALDRALKDNTPQSAAVALGLIKSLQDIVGQSNLFSGNVGEPLVTAMRYPDRQVRFEAAFALAAALPQKPFPGQDRVVPLLAEAVSQSGNAGVLIVSSQNDRARLATELKGYATAGGSNATEAIAAAASVPGVDVILMPEDLGNAEIDRVMSLIAGNPRLERAAKLIIVHSLASPWARIAITDPTLSYTEATGGPSLIAAIEQARKKAGGLPMDAKLASEFAVRAANLLQKLAISRGQVLDLSRAEPTLISSLADKRPEIAKAVGDALAMQNSQQGQVALAQRANDPGTAPDVRVSLYRSLATSAKFFGNRLGPDELNGLQQEVISEKNLDVRSAAAEARGALNLPATNAKALILQRHD